MEDKGEEEIHGAALQVSPCLCGDPGLATSIQ